MRKILLTVQKVRLVVFFFCVANRTRFWAFDNESLAKKITFCYYYRDYETNYFNRAAIVGRLTHWELFWFNEAVFGFIQREKGLG